VYSIKYIRQAIVSETLPPPDRSKAGNDYDALHALYESHQEGGVEGAQKAWKSIKKFVPHLDQKPKLYNANDLVNLVIPKYALPTGYAIYEFGFNILIGKRGAGKSFIALDIAARIAENNPNRTVIYTAGEGLPSYSPRWEAWKKHHQTHLTNLLFWDGAVQLLDAESYTQFANEVRNLRPIFIIVDTVARAMTGSNENDNTVMGQFVQAVDEMQRELEVGVLLVHHEGRNGEMRGASALDAAADSVLVLKRNERQIALYNDFSFGGKNKHQEEAPTLYFDFIPVDVTIQGALISAAVVVLSEKADEEAVEDDTPLKGNDAKIFEIIDANDGIGSDALAETAQIHRATAYRITDRLLKRGKIHQDKTKKWRTGQADT
jgi:hypothetical protein